MPRKRTLWAIFLGFALLLGAVLIPSGSALAREHRKDCRQRIEKQEQKLHQAIRRHGEHSRQTRKAREKLRDVRAKCGERGNHEGYR